MDLLIINGHDYSRFIKNTGYGWGRSDLDSDKSTRTKDGRLRRDKIGTKRKITFEVMGLTRQELAQLDDDLSQPTFSATYMDPSWKNDKGILLFLVQRLLDYDQT